MTEKHLGKIESVWFGMGGYQDCMLGIHFSFSFDGCGIGHSVSEWDAEAIKHSEHCKWTEKDRSKRYDEIVRYISKLLKEAKVDRVERLAGKPVEIETENRTFKSFRILTEVL